MKAAQLDAYNTPWEVREAPTPDPGPGEVLVEVMGAGACHSDLSVMIGDFPTIDDFPTILGHENAGRVAALNSAAHSGQDITRVIDAVKKALPATGGLNGPRRPTGG